MWKLQDVLACEFQMNSNRAFTGHQLSLLLSFPIYFCNIVGCCRMLSQRHLFDIEGYLLSQKNKKTETNKQTKKQTRKKKTKNKKQTN